MIDPTQAGAPAAPDAAPEPSGDYVIEIRSIGGKLSIGVEPMAVEAQEEGAPEGEADPEAEGGDYQPVGSIGEALKLVREIVAHAGQMTDTSASADEMSAGYKAGM